MPHLQSLLHLFIILHFLPYTTSQQQQSYPPQVRPNHVPAVIVGMFLFTVFFSFLACCICYKYSGTTSTPGINSDIEEGGRGRFQSRRTIRGLDKDVINSFPFFVYSQVKGFKIGKGGVECAICLNEFEDDETLRLLPPCSHVYHSDCIDVWLNSRSTCPVCRANLVPKPGNDDHDQIQSFPYPFTSQDSNQEMVIERGNTRRNVLESSEMHLIDNLRLNNNESRPPRSRSTGSSNWRINEILFPRSHSTGHSLVQLGENLDRFTLQLPEEVRRELISLNLRRSHTILPQARSSPLGYRSGSVGNEQRGFRYGRQYNQRNVSLSFSFSFQTSSLQSSPGRNDSMAFSKNLSRSIKSSFRKASVTSQNKEKESGERSFERLRPDMA